MTHQIKGSKVRAKRWPFNTQLAKTISILRNGKTPDAKEEPHALSQERHKELVGTSK